MLKDKKYKLYKNDVLSDSIATIKEDMFKDNLDFQLAFATIPSAVLSIALADEAFLKTIVPILLCNSSALLIYNGIKKHLCKEKLEELQILFRKKGIAINFIDDFIETKEIADEKGQKYVLNSFNDDKRIISKDNERFIYFDKDNYDGIEVTDAFQKKFFNR